MLEFRESFYFVRHGETEWNRKRLYQGPNDIPLNERGHEQAKSLIPLVSELNIQSICTSPLLRASQTAEIINSHLLKKTFFFPELMECKSQETAQFLLADKGVTNMPSFDHLEPHPESPSDFIDRVRHGLHLCLQETHPLIVSHGGVCWALCHILGLESLLTPNCCLIHFQFKDNSYTATVIN